MAVRSFVLVCLASVILLWTTAASAKPKIDIQQPSTFSPEIDVNVADGQVWSTRVTYPSGTVSPVNPEYYYSDWHEALVVPLRVVLTCPDNDEQLTAIKFDLPHVPSSAPGGNTGKKSMTLLMDVVLATQEELVGACASSGTLGRSVTISAACRPLVGKPDPKTIGVSMMISVGCDRPKVAAHVEPDRWRHSCPGGYELDDASPHGMGNQSASLGTTIPSQCRRINALLASQSHTDAKEAAKKTAEQLADEAFSQTLGLGRDALAIFNLAGYYTIYELANAPLDHLTSVLGIPAGKKVQAAAKAAIGGDSVVDPNWLFDEYFLIRPSWLVDPRLRGTATSLAKIGQAQGELWKLQQKGISTLHHLAQADPHSVATTMGAPDARGLALVTAAKDASAYNGNDADLAIQRDWVIHPAWLVDAGLLPSARVVRRAPQDVSSKPTVAVYTPVDPTKFPRGEATTQQAPRDAVPYRALPKIDPAAPLTGKGARKTSKSGTRPSTVKKGGRVGGPRNAGGGRGSVDDKPRGDGGRGRSEGD